MKLVDFENAITEEVRKCINDGFTIDVNTYYSSRYVMGRGVALRRDNERAVFWIGEDSKRDLYGEKCRYIITRAYAATFTATDKEVEKHFSNSERLKHHAKVLLVGYSFGWDGYYVDNMDVLAGILMRVKMRRDARYVNPLKELTLDEKGLDALRKIDGLKRCAPERIKLRKYEHSYGNEYVVDRDGKPFVQISKYGIERCY